MLVPDNKKEVALTEKQETFLTALFGEAQGNPRTAGDIAGYADYHQPLRALKEEIIKSRLLSEKEYTKIMSPIKMTKPK